VSHADARNRVYASRGALTADAELWALHHQQRSLIGIMHVPTTRVGPPRVPRKVPQSGRRTVDKTRPHMPN